MFKKSKKLKLFLGILAILALIRVILPSVTKFAVNRYLENFSTTLTAHVSDIDMAIIKGSYTLEGISAHIKKNDKKFLSIATVNTSLSWEELMNGLISSKVLIKNLEMNVTPGLMPAIKEHLASLDKTEKKEKNRVRIPRLDLINSKVSTDYIPSLTTKERILLSDLNARVTNLIPDKNAPFSPFNINGTLIGSGRLKIEGEMSMSKEKNQWTMDTEILNFDLTTLNRFLKEQLPLTFTRGELDLYAEAKSEGQSIQGYFKPFITGLDVIKKDENFKGPKHWIIEIISAIGNTTFKAQETMATRIPFTLDKEFKVDGGETIGKMISHGFIQEQSRGIENSIDLKEAQEEK